MKKISKTAWSDSDFTTVEASRCGKELTIWMTLERHIELTVADMAPPTLEREVKKHRDLLLPPGSSAAIEQRAQEEYSVKTRMSLDIPRRPNRDSAPLSFAQQRLWFLHQLEPENIAYNYTIAIRLEGDLDVLALRRALNTIVERHEVLRTTFAVGADGDPVQRIGPVQPVDFPLIDLSEYPEPERNGHVRRAVAELGSRRFDLARDLLLRAALFRLDTNRYVLAVVQHHVASDGWSTGILRRDLAALYAAYSQGLPNPLPVLAVQYADFAVWQRQRLQGEKLERQLAYWKAQLAGVSVLALPMDRPRPAVQSYRGARRTRILSRGLVNRLKALSRQEGSTLFMTLLAVFQVLLHRYTGQADIAVGTPIAGRVQPEVEELIGCFVNNLVLRTDLSGNPTFKELLAHVRETALQAYEHQDLPFEKLVEELNPERDQRQTPLFQVMFAVQNFPQSTLKIPGIKVTPIEIDSCLVKFDIFAALSERDRELILRIEYRTELFEAARIERMLGHFQALIEGIVATPEQRISELPLLLEPEKHQLMAGWNNTKRDYPSDKCIHQLFEEQMEKNPDAVAVVFETHQLTYRDLNTKANKVAHYLKQFGIGAGTLVAICMDRSIEMVIALLGTLKAQSAYVPLDPSYPKDRLSFMLRDSQAPVLITQQSFVDLFINHTAKIIALDTDWEKVTQASESNLAAETSSDGLAYVLYTSGSTGEPKGVAVSHRAVNRLVISTDYVQITPMDTLAQVSNVSFDAATFEIWGALLNGARLVLVARDTLLSPQSLSMAIERYGITTLFLTTALFNQMVEQIPTALGKLRHLLFGGEAVDPQRVKKLLLTSPPGRLLHMYGPTETTTFASWYRVEAVRADATTVPIGRPIANTEIYILDANLNLVPVGIAGEIHIGGPGLAQGYLNRPQLTEERFIRHPFSNDPQARLYKTGDLARYLPDGNIEFLGRFDDQVKVRGYRIELGEVEAALGQHPAVKESMVLVRDGAKEDPADKRLVAYIVKNPMIAASTRELRRFLRQKLPEYMLPAAIVFMDALPLTPNGKLDRKALPAPEASVSDGRENFVAPRSAFERIMVDIWVEVLQVERVSRDDNFFDLGGYSLLGIKLLAQIKNRLDVELPTRYLFESPTVAQLVKRIEIEAGKSYQLPAELQTLRHLRKLREGQGTLKIFCFPYYGGFNDELLHLARLAHLMGPEHSFYAVVAGPHAELASRLSVEHRARAYIADIRQIQPHGPYFLTGGCLGGPLAFETALQLQELGETVSWLALCDVRARPPSKFNRYLGRSLGTWVNYYVTFIMGWRGWRYFPSAIRFHRRKLSKLTRQERWHYIVGKTKRALDRISSWEPDKQRAGDGESDPSWWHPYDLKNAKKRYFLASRTYDFRPYHGKLTIITNEVWYDEDPTLGWKDFAMGGLDVKKLPGDHDAFAVNNFELFLRIMRESLRKAISE